MEIRYLYRGTTVGWPGNPVLRDRGMTCTTRDPLVATLFAIECRNHGDPVILAAIREPLEGLIGPENRFDLYEAAVNLRCPPSEFESRAEYLLDVDTALEILSELGFTALPVRIRGKSMLQQELEETHSLGMRLNPDQIRRFNLRMREIGRGRERA